MKTSFNLKAFRKQAFYEGAKAQIHIQSRCMMNCFKSKMGGKSGAQESWFSCLDEYNKDNKSGKWSQTYS